MNDEERLTPMPDDTGWVMTRKMTRQEADAYLTRIRSTIDPDSVAMQEMLEWAKQGARIFVVRRQHETSYSLTIFADQCHITRGSATIAQAWAAIKKEPGFPV